MRLIRVICVLDSDPIFSSNIEARDLEAETREVRSTNVRDDTNALSNCGTIEFTLLDHRLKIAYKHLTSILYEFQEQVCQSGKQ